MQVRQTHAPPTTIKAAKASYKKFGPRISSQESRQLERGGELYRRAEKIRENEKKRQIAKKRKQEREDRERASRRRLNIASQKPAIPRSQCRLSGFVKSAMPAIGGADSNQTNAEDDPWSEDEIDDDSLLDVAAPETLREACIEASHIAVEAAQSSMSLPSSIDLELGETLDDCFESNTQIEREMQVEPSKGVIVNETDSFGSILSTQDFPFSTDDMEDPNCPTTKHTEFEARASRLEIDKKLMPPPRLPAKLPPSTQACCRAMEDPFLDDFGLSSQDFQGIAC